MSERLRAMVRAWAVIALAGTLTTHWTGAQTPDDIPGPAESRPSDDAFTLFRPSDPAPPLLADIWRIVDAADVSATEGAQALTELGRSSPAALLQACWGRRPGGATGDDSEAPVESKEKQRVLKRALRSLQPTEQLAALAASCDGATFARRLMVIEEIPRIGVAPATPLFLHVIGGFEPTELAAPRAEAALRTTLRHLRGSDPTFLATLKDGWQALSPETQRLTTQALLESPGPDVVAFLIARIPAADPDAARALLLDLSHIPSQEFRGVTRSECDIVARLLRANPRSRVPAAAARLVAQIHDSRAVPDLIRLLGSDKTTVDEAHAALKVLSGADYDPDATIWQTWYDDELAWFDSKSPDLRAALKARDTASLLDAVREVAARPLFRDVFADQLGALLDDDSSPLRGVVASALGMLRSPRALPALVRALGSGDPVIEDAAFHALVAITGRRLPRQAAACRAALRLRD